MRLAFALVLFGSTQAMAAESYSIEWPHGSPEALFPGKTAKQVKAALASACFDKRLSVTTSDDNVACEYRPSNPLLVWTTPQGAGVKGVVRFNLVEMDDATRVMVSDRIVQANAFGQVKELRGEYADDAATLLRNAGGSLPSGAIVTGLDLGLDLIELGSQGVYVGGVIANGPGAVAGIQSGDEILSLNGKGFRYLVTLRERLAKLPAKESLTLQIRRKGQKVDVTVLPNEAPIPKKIP